MGVNSEMENILNNLKMYESNYNYNNNFGNNSNSDDYNKKKLTCVCKFVKASESSNKDMNRIFKKNFSKRNDARFSLNDNINNNIIDDKKDKQISLNLAKRNLLNFSNGPIYLKENQSNNISNNSNIINRDDLKYKKLDLLQKKIILNKGNENKGI
jgi:hypothetical protein